MMKIIRNNRLEEIKRIEHLLYGINYEVWLNLYGIIDPDLSIQDALRQIVSKDAVVSGVLSSSVKKAKKEIMRCLLYEGDLGHGPIKLEKKRNEIIELIGRIFTLTDIDNAEIISEFGFREGHPAEPVFWDFAFDIDSIKKRWIFIGSSSD